MIYLFRFESDLDLEISYNCGNSAFAHNMIKATLFPLCFWVQIVPDIVALLQKCILLLVHFCLNRKLLMHVFTPKFPTVP